MKKIKKIHIIVNPASGKHEAVLPVLHEAFKDSGIQWDVTVTHHMSDTARMSREYADKADVLGVYGGDGTVMEAINGLTKSKTPLAILPGGTGNVMAFELGIPIPLKEACELITQGPWTLKQVDAARFEKRHFILRTGMGFEAEMVKGAAREIKNRWGRLAYFLSGFQALKKLKMVRYDIEIDGQEHSIRGLDCIIANAGSIGYGDLTLDTKIDPSDGKLDVIVLKKMDWSFVRGLMRILTKGNPTEDRELAAHFQGQEIRVASRPAQTVVCDGEMLGKNEVHAKVLPQAVTILVPREPKIS